MVAGAGSKNERVNIHCVVWKHLDVITSMLFTSYKKG